MDILELAEKLQAKKEKEIDIKTKYAALDKIKKLTQEQRLDRIEEMLNINV